MSSWTSVAAKTSTDNSVTLTHGTTTTPYNAAWGTAAAAASTTITLETKSSTSTDPGTSTSVNAYNTRVIEIIRGAGVGQAREITDYTAGRVATVSPAWNVVPDTTSEYAVHQNSGKFPVQTNAHSHRNSLLKATESSVDDQFKHALIVIIDPNNSHRHMVNVITSYNGTTKIAGLKNTWRDRPNSDMLYAVVGEYGTVPSTNGTNTIINLDGNQTSAVEIAELTVELVGGTGQGQVRRVVSLDTETNALTVSAAWSPTPDTTTEYLIYGGWCGASFERVKSYAIASITMTGMADGAGAVLTKQSSFDSAGANVHDDFGNLMNRRFEQKLSTDYFRLRVTSLGTKLDGKIQTVFHGNRHIAPQSLLSSSIAPEEDCIIGRTAIMGRHHTHHGAYENATVTNGNLNINIRNPLSAFGEVFVVNATPVAQLKFSYGIHNQIVKTVHNPATHKTVTQAHVQSSQGQIAVIHVPQATAFVNTGSSNYFTLQAGDGDAFYVWFDRGGNAPSPTPAGTGISILITTETPSGVATAIDTAFDSYTTEFAVTVSNNAVTIENNEYTAASIEALDASNMPSAAQSTATVTTHSALLNLTTAPQVGDYALLHSRRPLRYRPGQGTLARFTTVYEAPASGHEQFAGVGNEVCGFFVGYNTSQQFCFMHKTGGVMEVRTLTIDSAPDAGGGDVIVTVDGHDFHITLAGSGTLATATAVAAKIAEHNFTASRFFVEQVGADVIFTARDDTLGSGAWDFDEGDSGISGHTFTQTSAAVAATVTYIRQEDWSKDKLDGNGPSGHTFVPTLGGVWALQWQWLGFGNIVLYFEDPLTGIFEPVHMIQYANSSASVSVHLPDLRLMYWSKNVTSAVAKSMTTASGALFVQGEFRMFGPYYSTSHTHEDITTDNLSNQILFKLRNPKQYRGYVNQVDVLLTTMTLSNAPSGANTRGSFTVRLVIDGSENTSNALAYTYVDEGNSCVHESIVSTGTALVADSGSKVYSTAISPRSSTTVDLTKYNLHIGPDQTLYVVYDTSTITSSNSMNLTVTLNWSEDN